MKATLTFDFSDRLNPDEQRELLGETITRNVPMEDILVEALRMRRAAMQPSDGRGAVTALTGVTGVTALAG